MKYEKFVDKLFDEDNCDTIEIQDESGDSFEFEQVALIPLEDGCYAILKNITPIEGVEDDEAFVFFIDEDEDSLLLCEDEKIVSRVFEEYDKLL